MSITEASDSGSGRAVAPPARTLYTTEQIAQRLDVPKHCVRYAIRSSAIPPDAVAGKTKFFGASTADEIGDAVREIARHRESCGAGPTTARAPEETPPKSEDRMRITEVSYRETASFGNYQNATIEAKAEVGPEGSGATLCDLREWVQSRLTRQIDAVMASKDEAEEVRAKSYELREIESQIEAARVKWADITAFMARVGFNVPGEVSC